MHTGRYNTVHFHNSFVIERRVVSAAPQRHVSASQRFLDLVGYTAVYTGRRISLADARVPYVAGASEHKLVSITFGQSLTRCCGGANA